MGRSLASNRRKQMQAAQQSAQEQLDHLQIMSSNFLWSSPNFVIKRKSGKWRLI